MKWVDIINDDTLVPKFKFHFEDLLSHNLAKLKLIYFTFSALPYNATLEWEPVRGSIALWVSLMPKK